MSLQRLGYDFPKLDIPTDTPWYLIDTTKVSQANLDYEYIQQLNHYYDAAETFIQTQTITRLNSPNPKNYIVPSFPNPIPQRVQITYNKDGIEVRKILSVDSRIPTPVVPPYEEPSTGGGFKTSGPLPVTSDSTNQALAALMIRMVNIESLLKQLLAK